MNEELLKLLKVELKEIINSAKILKISFKICNNIGIKNKYSENELMYFEALTARFSRLSDILIQKVLRTIISIELDSYESTRDLLNLSEKKNIISDAHKLAETRTIRNKIVHEYVLEDFENIFNDVLILTPFLLKDVKSILNYCKEKYNI
ncbi:MAG TPA: hypothetical protein PKD83_03945 [Ignavibacteria bacterium]|nr:hypothetical protein [Ignavibacteria bacterium]